MDFGKKYPTNLEKIFSDSDESSSRLNDSLLFEPFQDGDQFYSREQSQHHQFSQLVLKDYNALKQENIKPRQQQIQNGVSSKYPNMKVIIGGNPDQSAVDESLINIFNEIGGQKLHGNTPTQNSIQRSLPTRDLNQQQNQAPQNNPNFDYNQTVQLMNSIQKQLGSVDDSTQATSITEIQSQSQNNRSLPTLNLDSAKPITINNLQYSKRGDCEKSSSFVRQSISSSQLRIKANPFTSPEARIKLNQSQNLYGFNSQNSCQKIAPKNPTSSQQLFSPRYQKLPCQIQFYSQPNQFLKTNNYVFSEEQRNLRRQTENRVDDLFKQQKLMEREFIQEQNFDRMVKGNVPIFCIMCEEYIKITEIDTHSERECGNTSSKKQISASQITKSAHQPENIEVLLKDINEKILSIEVQLRIRGQSSLLHASNSLRAAGCLNDINIKNSISEIQGGRQKIAAKSQSDLSSLSLLILVDRMIHLANEKASLIQTFNNQNLNMPNGIISQQLQQQNNLKGFSSNPPTYRNLSEVSDDNYLKRENHLATQFQSDKDSEISEWTGSQISQVGLFTSPNKLSNQRIVNSPTNQNLEIIKKQFFELVLSLKFALPPNHYARNFSIQELYQEMYDKQIPKDHWNQFIRARLGI